MVGFFGGVGYFGVSFFGCVVQVVGVVAVVGSNWFDGLCVCGSVDGLMICVCVCVLMGLDRLIGVSWASVYMCGFLC